MSYEPDEKRYSKMKYRTCGNSGLKLPELSFGLWHNFGNITPFGMQQSLLRTAFDNGITHFDLANNYGPPYGEAEYNFGIHMDRDWHTHRDELIISSKAGFDMWAGPYGIGGTKKYLVASLNQSLKRMHLDYVDIFYHHVPDKDTPVEETARALDYIVRSGKALYVGISNYRSQRAKNIIQVIKSLGTPCLIEQPNYSMLDRWIEDDGLLDVLASEGVGCICFAPLANGLLTDRYLNGIPKDSRAAHDPRYLKPDAITEEKITKIQQLNEMAMNRGQKLSQMAIAWVLRRLEVTSALIGASKLQQIMENVEAVNSAPFTVEELDKIDRILK